MLLLEAFRTPYRQRIERFKLAGLRKALIYLATWHCLIAAKRARIRPLESTHIHFDPRRPFLKAVRPRMPTPFTEALTKGSRASDAFSFYARAIFVCQGGSR